MQFYVASGALGWDGRGWPWEKPLVWAGLIEPSLFKIVTKTVTLYPNKGYKWAVRPIRGGVWNQLGLPNQGILWWINKYGYQLEKSSNLILSIAPKLTDPEEDWKYVLNYMEEQHLYNKLLGLELNISCPNSDYGDFNQLLDYIPLFKEQPLPLIIKLNHKQIVQYTNKLARLHDLTDTISLNSVSLIAKKGAYSGKIAQGVNWVSAELLQILKFNVIWPSIWNYQDISYVANKGAQAVSFGAIHLLRPWAPTQYVKRFRKEANNAD